MWSIPRMDDDSKEATRTGSTEVSADVAAAVLEVAAGVLPSKDAEYSFLRKE